MDFTELTEQEALAFDRQIHPPAALFLYTPFCGTCKVAGRMLEIVAHMMEDLPIYQCDVNLAPDLCKSWEITSIPCILLIHKRTIKEKIYAVRSVDTLYRRIQQALMGTD